MMGRASDSAEVELRPSAHSDYVSMSDAGDDVPYTFRRYLVLIAFVLNAFLNFAVFSEFSSVPNISGRLFAFCAPTSPPDTCVSNAATFVGLPATIELITVIFGTVLVMTYSERRNWLTMSVGASCNFIGGWLRYAACFVALKGHTNSGKGLIYASSLFFGLSLCVIVCSFSSTCARWFPPRERTLAVSIAVQASNCGGLLQSIIVPRLVSTPADMVQLCFIQALLLTFSFLLFLAFHREAPGVPFSYVCRTYDEKHSVWSVFWELRALVRNKQFLVQSLCYGMLVAISNSVITFIPVVLHLEHFTDLQTGWMVFTFILSGVVSGIVASRACQDPHLLPPVLRAFFFITALSLTALSILAFIDNAGSSTTRVMSHGTVFGLLLFLLAVCGAGSIGFLGLALSAVVETTAPVEEELR